MSGAGIPEKLGRSQSIRYLENVRRDHEDLGRGRRLMRRHGSSKPTEFPFNLVYTEPGDLNFDFQVPAGLQLQTA